jgi:hypothetical protein
MRDPISCTVGINSETDPGKRIPTFGYDRTEVLAFVPAHPGVASRDAAW